MRLPMPETAAVIRVAADVVVFTLRAGVLNVLLVRRAIAPDQGRLALPGGFVLAGEDLEDAAYRELSEEAGLSQQDVHLEQLASFGAPGRDPRGRVVSVAWLALGADLPDPVAGSDAARALYQPVAELGGDELAFDHAEILTVALERARAKLEYSGVGVAFLPETFTITELREVYQAIWGVRLDPANFHRKVTGVPGFLEPAGQRTASGRGRPPAVFRGDAAAALHPPIRRGDT